MLSKTFLTVLVVVVSLVLLLADIWHYARHPETLKQMDRRALLSLVLWPLCLTIATAVALWVTWR